MRKNGDIFASLFFIFVGIGCILGALRLSLGTPLEPQAGFFPLLAGIFLSVLSIIHLIHALLKRSAGTRSFGAVWRPTFLIAGLCIYTIILDVVGYVIATIILSAIILRILETKAWWKLVTVGLAVSIGTYVLFDRVLGVTLPPGILKGVL